MYATNAEAIGTVVEVHVGTAVVEKQMACVEAIYSTAPVATNAAHRTQETQVAVAVPGELKLKRRVPGAISVVTGPGSPFGLPFCFSGQPETGGTGIVGAVHPLPQVVVMRIEPVKGGEKIL